MPSDFDLKWSDRCYGSYLPFKNSAMDSNNAIARKFGPPSLDTQLAVTSMTSVPADLGGVT